VSPVRYEVGFYVPEDGILQSRRPENLTPHKYATACPNENELLHGLKRTQFWSSQLKLCL
jgi:hypothetical protein